MKEKATTLQKLSEDQRSNAPLQSLRGKEKGIVSKEPRLNPFSTEKASTNRPDI